MRYIWLPDGLNFSRLSPRPVCRNPTSELPAVRELMTINAFPMAQLREMHSHESIVVNYQFHPPKSLTLISDPA